MTEIKKLTQELYERFGCADAPRAKTAKLLEQIDLEADLLVAKADALEKRVRHLEGVPAISYTTGTRLTGG